MRKGNFIMIIRSCFLYSVIFSISLKGMETFDGFNQKGFSLFNRSPRSSLLLLASRESYYTVNSQVNYPPISSWESFKSNPFVQKHLKENPHELFFIREPNFENIVEKKSFLKNKEENKKKESL